MEGNRRAGEAEQLLAKGSTLLAQQQPAAAIEAFDQVVRVCGDAGEPSLRRVVAITMAQRGTALLQLGRAQEAVATYEEVERRYGDAADIEIRKVVASALINKGSLLLDEQPAAAIQAFDQVVERYGGSAEPELRKLVAFAKQHRPGFPGIVPGARRDRTDGAGRSASDDPPDALGLHLLPGEHILWSGRPDPLRLFNSQDVFLVPFSLVWGGFSMSAALNGFSFSPASLVVLLFALFGQYLIWGRFIAKSWERRRTVYALTDQRVLSMRGRSSQMLPLGQLPAMTCTPRGNGSGTIVFGSPSGVAGRLADTGLEWMNSRSAPGVLAFRDIPDVATVYRLIYQHAGMTGSR